MINIDLESGWMPSADAAALLGISVAALRTRRRRERQTHPRHLVAGSVCFYYAPSLVAYSHSWRDGRFR